VIYDEKPRRARPRSNFFRSGGVFYLVEEWEATCSDYRRDDPQVSQITR